MISGVRERSTRLRNLSVPAQFSLSDDPELEIRSCLIAHDDFENSLLRLTRSIRAVLKPLANQSSQ